VLPEADLWLHHAEIAARLLEMPLLLAPLCVVAGAAVDILEDRMYIIACPDAASPLHLCAAMCSICRWRFAHAWSHARCNDATETMRQLTVRRLSPEFNTLINMDGTVKTTVIQSIIGEPVAQPQTAIAFRNALLIRRQTLPAKELYPLFEFAVLCALVQAGLPATVATWPDLVPRLTAINRRIFYLLALYLVDTLRQDPFFPLDVEDRIPGFGAKARLAGCILPQILLELTETGELTARTNSYINTISYVRVMRASEAPVPRTHALPPNPHATGLRTRIKWFDPVAALQTLAIRTCGRLPLGVPMHPHVPELLSNMRKWSLVVRPSTNTHFDQLYVRFICLGCMQADPVFVVDARGVVFCRHCDHSNMVWVNPMHMLLDNLAAPPTARAAKVPGLSCVVGAHTLRIADLSQRVLDNRLICAEHARQHTWLCMVAPSMAPLISRLLMTRDRRSRDFSALARR
jgi:hypothetical protein